MSKHMDNFSRGKVVRGNVVWEPPLHPAVLILGAENLAAKKEVEYLLHRARAAGLSVTTSGS